MQQKEYSVLITGFGPFSNFDINPSWEVVKILETKGLRNENCSVKLHCFQLPVIYEKVKTIVPELWEITKPDLTVHIGVSGDAKELTLEQQAHNKDYMKQDNEKCLPIGYCCVDGGSDCIISGIDMDNVCKKLKEIHNDLKVSVSTDPGKFLCDFTYYTSLHIDKTKCIFIHIPPEGQPYEIAQMAEFVKTAILIILKNFS